MRELTVVGAGPVGAYLSSLCAGFMEVAVLEEDPVAGGKACSGLVSPRFVDMLPQKVKAKGLVKHELRGAVIHFMGEEFRFGKSGTAAYVLDREVLDRRMAEHAGDAGAEIMYGRKVRKVGFSPERVTVSTVKRSFESHAVAGCDGASSAVARSLGSGPLEMVNGLIIDDGTSCSDDHVEMWFDKSLTKDGFFWKIPRGDSTEYGCMGKNVGFDTAFRFFGLRAGDVGRRAAPIPIGPTKTYAPRALLVGDAAGQTKPWSGGGLAYGFMAAEAAASVLRKAVEREDYSESMLSAYEAGWKERIMPDIQAGMMAREFYRDLDTKGLSVLVGNAESLRDMERGDRIDFDFPFTSMRKALRGERG